MLNRLIKTGIALSCACLNRVYPGVQTVAPPLEPPPEHKRRYRANRTRTRALLVATTFFFSASTQQAALAKTPNTLDDACWQLSFTEDFEALSLWNPETRTGDWKTSYIWGSDIRINNELQYYIDPRIHGYSPFSLSEGILTISARPTPPDILAKVNNMPYISGVLTTEEGFSQKYGRFEALAKVPKGKGLWAAFWLLPSFDQWPDGVAVLPEIDVMESLGNEFRTYHTTLHTNQSGKLTSHPYDHTFDVELSADFHLYSAVWTEKTVTWYLDGRKVAEHPTPSDFSRPKHFLLNLAVGGSWPGNPDVNTRFPAEYQIDYVKAWTPSPTAASHC